MTGLVFEAKARTTTGGIALPETPFVVTATKRGIFSRLSVLSDIK